MIKIQQIEPFSESTKTTLRKLRVDFFAQLQDTGNINPLDKLEEGIDNGVLYGITLSNRDKTILKYLKKNYKLIILGSPLVHERIIQDIKKRGWNSRIYQKGKTTPFGETLLKVFGYTSRFRSVQEKGIWFAKKLNIKTCPYCNAQYTMLVEKSPNESSAKFQFDHFFPKDRFPYLSVSLYNLVPSCASCNLIKSNEELTLQTHYHPYYNSIAPFSEFRINYPDEIEKLSFSSIRDMDIEDLSITYTSLYPDTKDFIERHDELFDLTSIYSRHKDIAHEILLNSVMYNRFYQKGTVSIKGLFSDKRTMLRYILRSYMNEDEMLKRPLTKLSQDAARQLKLI